jgi:hypothetical protein
MTGNVMIKKTALMGQMRMAVRTIPALLKNLLVSQANASPGAGYVTKIMIVEIMTSQMKKAVIHIHVVQKNSCVLTNDAFLTGGTVMETMTALMELMRQTAQNPLRTIPAPPVNSHATITIVFIKRGSVMGTKTAPMVVMNMTAIQMLSVGKTCSSAPISSVLKVVRNVMALWNVTMDQMKITVLPKHPAVIPRLNLAVMGMVLLVYL